MRCFYVYREGPLDFGGYCILNGNEYLIQPQENPRTNHICVWNKHAKIQNASFVCEIRSCHESKFRSSSTLYIYTTKPSPGSPPEIFVQSPYLYQDMPLFIMCRLLDYNTIDDCIHAMFPNYDEELYQKVKECLCACDFVSGNKNDLLEYVGHYTVNPSSYKSPNASTSSTAHTNSSSTYIVFV